MEDILALVDARAQAGKAEDIQETREAQAALEMITVGVAVLAAVFYFTGSFVSAFWLIVLAILSGLGAVARAVIDPGWYLQKRVEAGLDPQLDLKGLLLTKGILIVVLVGLAWHIGSRAGYF